MNDELIDALMMIGNLNDRLLRAEARILRLSRLCGLPCDDGRHCDLGDIEADGDLLPVHDGGHAVAES